MGLIDFTRFVNDLATVSGKAILPFFRSAIAAEDKARGTGHPFDPVTEADRAGEVAMRRLIQRTFPTHGIIGEEFGAERAEAEYVWVLDPIDGTRAFIAGLPTWGTLIGLTRWGAPAFGLMHQPFTGERFFGDGGRASFRGPGGSERQLRVRRCPDLKEAILSSTTPRMFQGTSLNAFERVEAEVRLTRFGCDCYAYCMLAAGHIDVVIEAGLKNVDIVPLIPIIEGAGGAVVSWDGGTATKGGAVAAVGDRRLLAPVLDRLGG